MKSPKLTYLPVSTSRGVAGLCFVACMATGAYFLWGIGGALFSLGLFMALDISCDEAIERFTKIKRGDP